MYVARKRGCDAPLISPPARSGGRHIRKLLRTGAVRRGGNAARALFATSPDDLDLARFQRLGLGQAHLEDAVAVAGRYLVRLDRHAERERTLEPAIGAL